MQTVLPESLSYTLSGAQIATLIGLPFAYLLCKLSPVIVFSKCLYNLFLHPLARYPGPFWARCTGWWQTLQGLQGRESHAVLAAHQKYGHVVRVAPSELSFSKPSAADGVYATKKSIIKADFYENGHFLGGERNIFAMRHTKQHSQRRKLMTNAFSQGSMLSFLPELDKKVQEYLLAVRREMKEKGTANFFELSHWFAFEVVNMLAYNADLGMLKTGKPHPVMKDVLASGPTFMMNNVHFFDPARGKYLPVFGSAYAALDRFAQFGADVIANWRQTGESTRFMQQISENSDEFMGRPLNDREILEESIGMMFAGSGTTANTFAYLFWELSRNPDVQKKLYDELKMNAEVDGGAYLTYQTIKNLPYLSSVVKECMRLWPTIPGSRPRLTLEPHIVDGTVYPANTTLSMRNLVTHRDAETFPDPYAFKPERWETASKAMQAAETGFGSGSRACIGRNLAMMELLLLVANVVWNFDLKNTKAITTDDMWMIDNFNGAPRCHSTELSAQEKRS